MNTSNKVWWAVWGAVILAVIAVWIAVQKAPTQIVQTPPLGSLTGPDINSQYLCVSGWCQWNNSGSLAKGTTTILWLANPVGRIANVDLVALTDTGIATTTYKIGCGTSTAPTGTDLSSSKIIASDDVASSTNFLTMINGEGGASASTSPNGVQRMQVKSTEVLKCVVTTKNATLYDPAFTDVTSTFAGTFHVRWLYSSDGN